jgi:hypothetical protein
MQRIARPPLAEARDALETLIAQYDALATAVGIPASYPPMA